MAHIELIECNETVKGVLSTGKEYEYTVTRKLISNHPGVEKAWSWGGKGFNDDEIYSYLSLLMKNGNRKDFKFDSDIQDAILEANIYLTNLNT